MSEPEWSLPMNRAELIARCEALQAELHEVLRDAPYVYAKRQDSIRRLLAALDIEVKG